MSDQAASSVSAPVGRKALVRIVQLLSLALVAALLVLLVWRVVSEDRGETLVARIKAGEAPAAPGFELPVIWSRAETWPAERRDGRLSVRELRGYAVVINFWASWCDPCKDEAPILSESAQEHTGEVVFLGLDVQDFTSDARTFLRRYGANYVSVRDPTDDVYEAYGLTGIPETFYLDGDGRAVAHSLGQLSARELEAGIAKALRED